MSAFREVVERLTADDEIRALHTRAVANGEKWYLSSVGNFGHIVVWGAEKDKTLAKVKETLAKPSASVTRFVLSERNQPILLRRSRETGPTKPGNSPRWPSRQRMLSEAWPEGND